MEVVENMCQSSALVINHDHHYLLHGAVPFTKLVFGSSMYIYFFSIYIYQLRVETFKSFMSSK